MTVLALWAGKTTHLGAPKILPIAGGRGRGWAGFPSLRTRGYHIKNSCQEGSARKEPGGRGESSAKSCGAACSPSPTPAGSPGSRLTELALGSPAMLGCVSPARLGAESTKPFPPGAARRLSLAKAGSQCPLSIARPNFNELFKHPYPQTYSAKEVSFKALY